MVHLDNFSEWHRCNRWTSKGMDCPFRPLEEEDRKETDEDVQARPSGAMALERALQGQLQGSQVGGLAGLLGPLLAFFTVVRGVQTLKGLPIGNVTKAGFAEEATTRVLNPKVPAREGPTPAKRTVPVRTTAGSPFKATGAGRGGHFFESQAAELGRMVKGR